MFKNIQRGRSKFFDYYMDESMCSFCQKRAELSIISANTSFNYCEEHSKKIFGKENNKTEFSYDDDKEVYDNSPHLQEAWTLDFRKRT